MAQYALIKTADDSLVKLADGDIEFPDGAPELTHKGLKWVIVEETPRDPAFDPETEIALPKVETVEAERVHRTFPTRVMTAPELADRATSNDTKDLSNSLLDLAEVVIIHVDAHLAKGNIVAGDFNAETRQKYLGIKAIVDRLRGA